MDKKEPKKDEGENLGRTVTRSIPVDTCPPIKVNLYNVECFKSRANRDTHTHTHVSTGLAAPRQSFRAGTTRRTRSPPGVSVGESVATPTRPSGFLQLQDLPFSSALSATLVLATGLSHPPPRPRSSAGEVAAPRRSVGTPAESAKPKRDEVNERKIKRLQSRGRKPLHRGGWREKHQGEGAATPHPSTALSRYTRWLLATNFPELRLVRFLRSLSDTTPGSSAASFLSPRTFLPFPPQLLLPLFYFVCLPPQGFCISLFARPLSDAFPPRMQPCNIIECTGVLHRSLSCIIARY